MPAAVEGEKKEAGLEALHRLKFTESPVYLTPSPDLAKAARLASEYLFSLLTPYAAKSPLNQLYTEGFDAEQIWQQIDLQAQPLLSILRRHVRNFEKDPEEIKKQFSLNEQIVNAVSEDKAKEDLESLGGDLDNDIDEDEEDEEEEEEEEGEEEEGEEEEGEEEEEEEGEEEEGDDDDDEYEGNNASGVEDKFLKLNELEKYLLEDEAREFGMQKEKTNRKRPVTGDEDEDADEEDDDELGIMELDADGDDEDGMMENARYEDLFGDKRTFKKKRSRDAVSDDMGMDHRLDDGYYDQGKNLSKHEKDQEKLRSEIEKMERSNLEPKTWTMHGEVTAAKRPKNSALEVDLDFEHNVRPAPVITEEVTQSIEELIQKRIVEGRFDDIPKRPTLPAKAPREKKELDENKSKKGLAELYEDEYAQKTGLVSTALSFADEQKKEASMLFKQLCVKLDALSHFYFTPKPVIEDMSIRANVPALAMEEVAPLAVSDAAMLAPEEIYSSKGDIKEESELTKKERKRRRANKKRKFRAKAAQKTTAKAQLNTLKNQDNGNKDS